MAKSIFSSMEPVASLMGATQAPSLESIFAGVIGRLTTDRIWNPASIKQQYPYTVFPSPTDSSFPFPVPQPVNTLSGAWDYGFPGSNDYQPNVLTEVSTAGDGQSNAFMWVEASPDPDIIATADSMLIGFGAPIYSQNDVSGHFPAIGFCSSFNFSTTSSVTALKELRTERTLIIPGKSSPGSVSLSRLLTTTGNLAATINGSSSRWEFDNQLPSYKTLFGLLMVFMTPSRRGSDPVIGVAYAERCTFAGNAVSVNAGQYGLYENIQIVYGRIVSPSTISAIGGLY